MTWIKSRCVFAKTLLESQLLTCDLSRINVTVSDALFKRACDLSPKQWASAAAFVSLRRFSFLLCLNLCADFRSYWWISAQIFVLTVFTGSEMFTDCRVCIVSLTYAWLELDQKHSTWTRQLNALYARPSEARLLKILVIEQLKLRQGKIQQLPKLEVLSKSLHWI